MRDGRIGRFVENQNIYLRESQSNFDYCGARKAATDMSREITYKYETVVLIIV